MKVRACAQVARVRSPRRRFARRSECVRCAHSQCVSAHLRPRKSGPASLSLFFVFVLLKKRMAVDARGNLAFFSEISKQRWTRSVRPRLRQRPQPLRAIRCEWWREPHKLTARRGEGLELCPSRPSVTASMLRRTETGRCLLCHGFACVSSWSVPLLRRGRASSPENLPALQPPFRDLRVV